MGSHIEINDTLQLTRAQGFPTPLELKRHQQKPFTADDFAGQIFAFTKEGIRYYQPTPIRVFLVENVGGKWLYWGLVHILEVTHDYRAKVTSGKFSIICIYTPEQMRQAFDLMDRREEKRFLLTKER